MALGAGGGKVPRPLLAEQVALGAGDGKVPWPLLAEQVAAGAGAIKFNVLGPLHRSQRHSGPQRIQPAVGGVTEAMAIESTSGTTGAQ